MEKNTDTSARTRLILALAERLGNERSRNRVHKIFAGEANDQSAGTVFEAVANELRKMGVDPGDTPGGIASVLGVEDVLSLGRGRFEESILGSEVADNLRALVREPAALAA